MNNLPANIAHQWEAQAQALVQHERPPGAAAFSTRGGMLMLGEERMLGDQVCAIVLDAIRINTFYGARYDADQLMPPICYAAGRVEEEMGPHESMQVDLNYFRPQNDPTLRGACHACPMNRWGSADQGRGKACQNRRELTLVPAGIYMPRRGSRDFDLRLFDDPQHYLTADTARLRLPVMSVAGWARYVNLVAAQFQRPPAGVITRVFIEPDPRSQYRVGFELVEPVSDTLAGAIIQRQAQVMGEPFRGFPPPDTSSARQPVPQGRSLRR